MKLTRAGFNILVMVWLAPLVFLDLFGNANSTGNDSDYFYYKMIADGVLFAFAAFLAFGTGKTASVSSAKEQMRDPANDVMSFEQIGSWEYIYCALLVVYALVNWWFMHSVNRDSTGAVALASAIWSFVSLAVAILSAVQFYHLKQGSIVALRDKMVAK
jgi:hypothetical protein